MGLRVDKVECRGCTAVGGDTEAQWWTVDDMPCDHVIGYVTPMVQYHSQGWRVDTFGGMGH